MHTICGLQREQPVDRFKAKTLTSLCTNEKTQTIIFLIDQKNILSLKTTIATIFYNNINRFMHFPNKDMFI